MLLNYHIGRLVLSSLCVGDLVWLGFEWCSFCRLQNEHHSNQLTNLTHKILFHNKFIIRLDMFRAICAHL